MQNDCILTPQQQTAAPMLGLGVRVNGVFWAPVLWLHDLVTAAGGF
jgi:hypothetical protein